jgi:hypothetical protein
MQAPPTSGEPAQDRRVLVCPDCRALNAGGGTFCWQCFRPFNGADAVKAEAAWAAGAVPPRPPPPALAVRGVPWTERPVGPPVSAPARRSLHATVGAILLAVAVGAGVFAFLNRGPDVALPESFGGLSRMQDAQIDALLEEFRAEAARQGVDADMALYGSAGLPSAGLIWVKDLAAPSTDEAFDAFATGFNQELGVGSLDRSRTSTSSTDGISFLCAPVDASGQPANLCVWEDGDGVFWILLDLSGTARLSGTEQLAVSAHNATSA